MADQVYEITLTFTSRTRNGLLARALSSNARIVTASETLRKALEDFGMDVAVSSVMEKIDAARKNPPQNTSLLGIEDI